MLKSLLAYIAWRVNLLLPGNHLCKVRNWIWRRAGFDVDPSARLMNCVRLICGDIHVGCDTFIGAETMITGGRIIIGRNCDIAPRAIIHAGSHETGSSQRRAGKVYSGNIEIGDGCWLGTSAILLDGAKIGKGCVVAAGSLVKTEFPDNVLVAGVPAVIKKELP
jgi:acetyltransferase-like isoleucine patch superfamily enzyme